MFKPRMLRRVQGARVGPDALVREAEQSSSRSLEDAAFRRKRSRLRNKIVLVALISLCSIVPLRAQSRDLPPGAAQAKVRTACLECHNADIIVQQRLSKAVWTKEVDKMTKWGALIEAADRDSIVDYLSTNFPPDKPPAEMPRMPAKKR